MFVVGRADEGVLGCFTTKERAKKALLELEPKMKFEDAGEGFARWFNPETGIRGYIEDFSEDEWSEDIDYSFIDVRESELNPDAVANHFMKLLGLEF